ncbi:hypothetical protein FEM48_Zijuj07G0006400 [Ziziphus jujuba var. spinosa]|uniref:Uncharacterized protein n=1 Tax=Ziziphus jujuba var. spinosa TaxID=714518 RepID=A0A978V1F0_ZIZJJ|nr:hypothetical protein FEM48_Zijuj07G0006400 [Ziziphus jujuba var. spinosa]
MDPIANGNDYCCSYSPLQIERAAVGLNCGRFANCECSGCLHYIARYEDCFYGQKLDANINSTYLKDVSHIHHPFHQAHPLAILFKLPDNIGSDFTGCR